MRGDGNEHQLVVGGALRVPFEEVLGADRRAVFVDAEDRKVQVVARIREVVRIAAEKGHLLFRREHQSHIRVLLITIEPVLSALIQGDDVGTQAGPIEAFLLDGRNLGPAGVERCLRAVAALCRRDDPRRDFFVRHQDVQLEVGGLQLLTA